MSQKSLNAYEKLQTLKFRASGLNVVPEVLNLRPFDYIVLINKFSRIIRVKLLDRQMVRSFELVGVD